MDSRTAISGLIPARQLRIDESVLRLTPRALAASVTDMPRGSKQSSRRTSPGCGGLCIRRVMSVIVLVVDQDSIFAVEGKRDSPVATDGHGPTPFQLALELMQVHQQRCPADCHSRTSSRTDRIAGVFGRYLPACEILALLAKAARGLNATRSHAARQRLSCSLPGIPPERTRIALPAPEPTTPPNPRPRTQRGSAYVPTACATGSSLPAE